VARTPHALCSHLQGGAVKLSSPSGARRAGARRANARSIAGARTLATLRVLSRASWRVSWNSGITSRAKRLVASADVPRGGSCPPCITKIIWSAADPAFVAAQKLADLLGVPIARAASSDLAASWWHRAAASLRGDVAREAEERAVLVNSSWMLVRAGFCVPKT
jgi:hypothetical protein